MNGSYSEAAVIHRVQRDVFVNSNPPQGPNHLKGKKHNINRVHIPYITSSLRMSQILRVLPKLNIYINTPTPFAETPEANYAKGRPSKSNGSEGKSLRKPTRTPGNPFARPNAPTHKIQPETS